jgi:hypothetical protein
MLLVFQGSFGNAQTFGENLVGSMDQSFLARAPNWAKGNQQHQAKALTNLAPKFQNVSMHLHCSIINTGQELLTCL